MSDKVCRQCNTPKPLEQFYEHPMMADGHLNKCIDCVRSRVKKYAHNNPEKVRVLTREKARRPKYRLLNKAWRDANPEQAQAIKDRWVKKNRDKRHAHAALEYALRIGKITRGTECARCGATTALEAHHEDYSKPLDVEWLCLPCHGETRHKEPSATESCTSERFPESSS